jgi:hypothetical protein
MARHLLYGFDRTSELNIKARLLKSFSEDEQGKFRSRMASSGLFVGFVEEAWKNYEAAREALNDLLRASKLEQIPREVVVDAELQRLRPYLEDSLSFGRFDADEVNERDLTDMVVEGQFFARTFTINYRRIFFDIVSVAPQRGQKRQSGRKQGYDNRRFRDRRGRRFR